MRIIESKGKSKGDVMCVSIENNIYRVVLSVPSWKYFLRDTLKYHLNIYLKKIIIYSQLIFKWHILGCPLKDISKRV